MTKAKDKEMENLVETMCRLCLSSENCEMIDNHTRGILGILLPKWHLDEGKHFICNDCSIKLFAAFDFKRICLNTEDCIFLYVNSEKGGILDIREIYSKENDTKLSILEFQNVCRLCMQLIFGEFIGLEQLDVNMLNTYIPEINFSSIENPVICEACYEAFKSHSVFLTICFENEKKIKYVNDGISALKTEKVDITEDVAIKTEEDYIEPEEFHIKIEEVCLKTEENETSDLEEEAHETEKQCKFEISDEQQQQLLVHRDPSKIEMYKCDECSFTTEYKMSMRSHKLSHKNACELNMYKCDRCSYKTWQEKHLKSHMVVHKDPHETQVYECDECSFKSQYKSNLQIHKLRHKDPSKKRRYLKTKGIDKKNQGNNRRDVLKCEMCSFQTTHTKDLKSHQLLHTDLSQIKKYKCDDCSYMTKDKSNWLRHKLVHRNPSEVEMYKCNECNYQTKWKKVLQTHKLRHQDPSQLEMYECDECSYKTKFKANLQRHKRLRHTV